MHALHRDASAELAVLVASGVVVGDEKEVVADNELFRLVVEVTAPE